MAQGKGLFFGWRVVWATFVLGVFAWGVGLHGPPIFLHALGAARGWPVALISSAATVHFLAGSLVAAAVPLLHRRLGLPATIRCAALCLALGAVGWSQVRHAQLLFVAALFSGAGWGALGGAALNAIISPWFVARRPAALSMAFNGASFGGVVFPALWTFSIGHLGLGGATALIAIVMTLTLWTLTALYFTPTPASLGIAADGIAADAPKAAAPPSSARALPGGALIRDWRFLTLTAGASLGLFAQVGLFTHLFSLLVPALGAQGASFAVGAATLIAIAGRTLVGWSMPAGTDRRIVACVSYGLQGLGSLLLFSAAGDNVPLLLAGLAFFGIGVGNATSLPPLIAQVEFVPQDTARVVPLVVSCSQGLYAFAPAAFGLLRPDMPDMAMAVAGSGNAPGVYLAAAALQGLAILTLLAGRR